MKRKHADRSTELDRALRSLFKGVEVRVVPDRLLDVIDQLDAQTARKARAA